MHENRMGTERLPKLIMLMSLPAMFSMLIQSLYNVVDSYYVSQLSEQAFRAVTIAMPMQQLLIAVGVGTAVGANSFIARSLGEKNQQMANRAAVHGFFLCGANWLLFLCIGLFFAPFFYAQFTVDPLVQTQGISYLRIVCSLSGGSILLIMIEKILQATGDMIRPMLMQLTGAVINIVLDPILIFGLGPFPAMGVSGAAIATVFSQWAACGLALFLLFRENHGVDLTLRKFRPSKEILHKIYQVGLPSILIISITSFMVMTLNSLLRKVSEQLISVLGVYFRLQSFVFMPIFGMTQGLMPIMAYNYGAKNRARLMGALRIGILVSLLIMTGGFFLFQTQADGLLFLFNATPLMMEMGVPALRIISLAFWFAGVNICLSTFFQALGLGKHSLLLSLSRQYVFIVPLVAIFRFISIPLTWLSFLIVETISLVVAYILFRRVRADYL